MSVEGIPNGWRLVRVGRVCHGETYVDKHGNPLKWLGSVQGESKNLVIIEMIKDSKKYREPELSDLANGPLEIEACTPDPHTGERRWRKRKLVAIQTGGRKPFVVQHPNQPGLVVCYKEARIEVVASSEASKTDHIADAKPLVIPEGWRELKEGELLSMHDLYELNGEWTACKHDPLGDRYSSRIHRRHIRKIEQAPQAEQFHDVKVTIYREPTQRDLANGPIRCRVRDSKESEWEIMNLYAVLPERVEMRFIAIGDADSIATTWKYCEIPSDHQAIRVGDLVRVTARPIGVYREGWRHEMNRQVNEFAKVSGITHDGRFLLNGCGGWRFHRDWLELVETASEAKGGEA